MTAGGPRAPRSWWAGGKCLLSAVAWCRYHPLVFPAPWTQTMPIKHQHCLPGLMHTLACLHGCPPAHRRYLLISVSNGCEPVNKLW